MGYLEVRIAARKITDTTVPMPTATALKESVGVPGYKNVSMKMTPKKIARPKLANP